MIKMNTVRLNTCSSLWSNKRQFKRPDIEETLKQIAEFNERHNNLTYCEVMRGDPPEPESTDPFDRYLTPVKPFFDYDEYISPVPHVDDIPALLADRIPRVEEATQYILRGALPFEDVEYSVNTAERCGPTGEGFKVR